MKKRVILGTLVAATLLMTACGNSEATTKSESKGGSNALVVSTFGLSEDIVKKDIIAPFEKENEAKVTLEVGNSADRFTKLKNNPNAGIDVIELAQANAAQGGKEGLFEKITEKEVPNLSQLTPGALMLYVASEHAGQDITKDNGKAAFEAMKELKPNVVKTYSKSSDLANMFQSGEIEAAVVADFAVDIIQGAAENVTYIVPESGTYANYNTVNIPKKAQNKETAFKFVNARISEESQKAKAISLNEGPTNQQVTLSEKEAKNKTYGAIAERAKTVDFNFINSQLADWIDQWNRTMNQ